MAIVPALATMAALTLLQNPAAQPEGVSVDYSPFAGPARRIQRAARRKSAIVRIQSAIRQFLVSLHRVPASASVPLLRGLVAGGRMRRRYYTRLDALLRYRNPELQF